MMTILSPLLFFAPDVHMETLRLESIDYIAARVPLRKLQRKLQKEWDDINIYVSHIQWY